MPILKKSVQVTCTEKSRNSVQLTRNVGILCPPPPPPPPPLMLNARWHTKIFHHQLTKAMSNPLLKNRLQALEKLRCLIFGTNFNPENKRTGAKVLRKRLVGPTISNYYNRVDFLGFKDISKMFPQFNFVDLDEQYRLSMVAA